MTTPAININSADAVIESARIIREILNHPGSEELRIAALDALETIARPAATNVSNCQFTLGIPQKKPKAKKSK